jgi:hypothetical protein
MEPIEPSNSAQTSSPKPARPKRTVFWSLICLGFIVIVLGSLYLAASKGKVFVRADWARSLGLPTATLACVRPALLLGASSFPLEAVALPAEGGLPEMTGEAGTAWWVSDTFNPYIFFLTPLAGDPDLRGALKEGDPVVIQWADCGREEFAFAAVQEGALDLPALLAQDTPGILVIVRAQDGAPAYTLQGVRPGLAQPETPEPTDPNAVQADILFNGTAISADGKTLQTNLTITNVGSQPISLTANDFSLSVEDGAPLNPLRVEPALPQQIPPGSSLSLALTFPNPGGHMATLKLLDLAVDIYY